MALIQCPDCTNSVSDQAELCRHCGRPIKNAITIRLEREEIELDLFDPHEAQRMRTQIIKNESSINVNKNTKAAQTKKKKRAERMSLIRNIVLILIAGVAAYFYKRMS